MGIWRSLPGFASRKPSSKKSRAKPPKTARAKRGLRMEQFEDRRVLAVLVSIIPNEGDILTNNDVRDVAPRELTFRFDQGIDPTTLGAITVTRAGLNGMIGSPAPDADDVVYGIGANRQPFGFIGVNPAPNQNEVVVRFAETLPDDLYQIRIDTTLLDTSGGAFNPNSPQNLTPVPLNFNLNLGAQVISVVPQPITRQANGSLTQAADKVEVYFSEALNPTQFPVGGPAPDTTKALFQLIDTNLSADTSDDTVLTPSTVTYDTQVINGTQVYRVTLQFASPLGTAAYRLRVGDNLLTDLEPNLPDPEALGETDDAGNSTFTGAQNLAAFSATLTTKLVAGAGITADSGSRPYNLDFPGGNDEPGHRDIPAEVQDHLGFADRDNTGGISTFTYAFPKNYGAAQIGNAITANQMNRAREIFELYSHYLGVQFVEVPQPSSGSAYGTFNIVTGQLGVVDAFVPPGVGGTLGIAGAGDDGRFYAIMEAIEPWGNSEYGGSWFQTAMHEIGHLLGLGHSYELPSLTIQGSAEDGTTGPGEPVFPGDHDIVHGQRLYRPEGNDIDVYKFTLDTAGLFSAETIAERLGTSQLDTVITLYRETAPGVRELIARNDDYFSEDSYLELDLLAGTYYVAVTSTGNTAFDPTIPNSGLGGTTEGSYDLRLNFTTAPSTFLRDADTAAGTILDGDADGTPGGAYNFWFKVDPANTVYVDKAYNGALPSDGSLARPYKTINSASVSDAFDRVQTLSATAGPLGVILRVVGNGGSDNDPFTANNNQPYVIGTTNGLPTGPALADGATLNLPKNVTMMVDAGAIFKLRGANINAGSTAVNIDLSGGAIQVLGTPQQSVFFTSYANDALGGDSNANGPPTGTLPSGDWGGIVFRNDSDLEASGVFLNYVNHADMSYGGGTVTVGSFQGVFASIHMVEARPAVSFNFIHDAANAAISADPRSFEDSKFQGATFTADYDRIGPDVHGNRLQNNSINGLFVRIRTGNVLTTLDRPARFNDTDIVHVITENLVLQGTPGGQIDNPGSNDSRVDARLAIDAGTIVKLQGARIEAQISTQLIAEGRGRNEVVFTSIRDDRYGRGGTFDTANDLQIQPPLPGDWGGLYFGPLSQGSLDHANIQYGGGRTSIEGGFANFNTVEIQQADVRIANSLFANNANGLATTNRAGRLTNAAGVVFVRGAQPVIVNNIFRDNNWSLLAPTNPSAKSGDVISINANALVDRPVADPGRSTGEIDVFAQYGANHGPLVRLNRLQNNATNAMAVRGATLTTQTLWDDTDTVHVLRDEIQVPNFHTYGGLRLQSSTTESLIVKLDGPNAGFTATGTPLDIDDRIGGSVQIVGQPGGRQVVLTSIHDDTVGAGIDVRGLPQNDTNDNGAATSPAPGNWRSVRLDRYGNDRNVAVINELEPAIKGKDPDGNPNELNGNPDTAQFVGTLAPDEKSGDDNRRLGFEIHGTVALDDRHDVDVYSFNARTNTEVWIDVDRTAYALDSVVELVDASGFVLARSDNSPAELALGAVDFVALDQFSGLPIVNARTMQRDPFNPGGDLYTTNPRDPGFRVFLPGDPDTNNLYYVRVRSRGADVTDIASGESQGEYQLQIRLRELDEIPGSTVRYADMRYAINAVEVLGMPGHSPLLGETAERDEAQPGLDNDAFDPATPGAVQDLGNLLAMDRNTISVGGNLTTSDDVDWYRFTLDYQLIQAIAGANDAPKTWATVFDIDYADGATARADTYLSVFDSNGNLLYVGRDSDVADDQPRPDRGSDFEDLAGGSFGQLDPYIGSAQLREGTNRTYYVAVSSNAHLPQALNFLYQGNAANELVKLEPVTSIQRIAEDHFGQTGYISGRTQLGFADVDPTMPGQALIPIGDNGAFGLSTNVRPFQLSDVTLYVSTASQLGGANRLWTVDPNRSGPFETNVGPLGSGNEPFKDITIRSDGQMFGYQSRFNPAGTAGDLVLLDAGDAVTNTGSLGSDMIPDNIINTANVDSMAWNRTGSAGGVPTYDLFFSVSSNNQGRLQSYLFQANPANGNATTQMGTPFGERGLVLTGPNITLVPATGATPAEDIVDGMQITVSDGLNTDVILEFESGIELTTSGLGATNAANAIDAGNVNAFNDPDPDMDPTTPDETAAGFQISVDALVVDFEFDINNTLINPNAVRVPVTNPMTPAALATALATAINASPLGNIAVASRDRVTIRDNNPVVQSMTYSPSGPVQQRLAGNGFTPGGFGASLIVFNATSTAADIGMAIANALNNAASAGFTTQAYGTFGGSTVEIGLATAVNILDPNLMNLIEVVGSGPGGAITGMAFLDGSLYGVSANGGFYQIPTSPGLPDPRFGGANIVTPTALIPDPALWIGDPSGGNPGMRFQGLTLGPQNLDHNNDGAGGDLARMFFAITTDGRMTVLDEFGAQQGDPNNGTPAIFDVDRDGAGEPVLNTGLTGVTGLAFSNLDFNLWHPTMQRRNDPGHGVNNPLDDSRSGNRLININGRRADQFEGNASFYFGLENWDMFPALNDHYFTYGANSQYGILSQDAHRDLASNPAIRTSDAGRTDTNGSYNLPGGAHGSLITNPFSLEGYNYSDKPTLYFNYYLVTQNANDGGVLRDMRDSARVLVSTDGGNTWVQVATNNSDRTVTTNPLNGELPEFATANSITNRTGLIDDRRRVQELFDTTDFSNEWRQARIDLGEFVGAVDVRLRFDFSTAADMETAELASQGFIQGDQAGDFNEEERGQDNQHEGFYVDDIIVGFAEHGELVTGAAADTNFFAVPQARSIVPEERLTGPYQLEIRRGTETAVTLNPRFSSTIVRNEYLFDTNARFSDSFTVVVTGAFEDTLQIDDGERVLTFEFDTDGSPQDPANILVPITGLETPDQLAGLLAGAINAADFEVTASSPRAADSIVNSGLIVRSPQVHLFEAAFVTSGSGGAFNVIDNSLGNVLTRSRGDTNLHRDQGQIIIEANSISDTRDVGILVDNGLRDANGNPHPASVRNLPTLNVNGVVPGLLVENNLVVNSGQAGIRFSGEATDLTQPLASVPFGRINNNTVFGNAARTGIGIDVTENASPTILNNLVSNLAVGISVDGSSQTTVLGQNMFDLNTLHNSGFTLDAGDITTLNTPGNPNAEPVFVNAAARNFYPASIRDPITQEVTASQAIDSSINSLPQRADLAAVTQPLGIPESPILAPELDLLGIERVDDPDVESPPGAGSDVFKDRGALDRADFDGPLAVLANPVDNVPPDTHPDVNRVVLPPGDTLLNFTIQFVDTNGSGIDNSTVDTTKFTLKRNGVTLVDGTHYIFSYDRTNKLVRFIPVQGLWLPGSVFEITIVNNDSNPLLPGIKDLAQNLLEPNNANLETKFTIVLPSPGLPQVAVSPATITVPEGNTGATNKAVFTVTLTGVSAVDAVVNYATANGNSSPATKNATAGQDYVATNGTLTFAPGETSKTVEVDIIGDLNDEDNEEFRLVLTLPPGPPTATIGTGTGVATITDDDNPNITIGNAMVLEGTTGAGATNLVFTVSLSTPPTLPVSVAWSTANGGVGETFAVGGASLSTAGVDYLSSNGMLTIPANSTTGTISIPITKDALHELNETFLVNLSNPANGVITDGQAVGTIQDDDSGNKPTLAISSTPSAIREGAPASTFVFTLSLDKASGLPITVNYSTINSSATAGQDFTGITNGQVIFLPGELTKTVSVQVLNDTIDEANETFLLRAQAALTNPTRVTNGSFVQAAGTIQDNDGPTVTITPVTGVEGDPNQPVKFEFALSASSRESVEIEYEFKELADMMSPLRATAGTDYTPPAKGTIRFNATPVGTPTPAPQIISVPVLNDVIDEQDEQFRLTLNLTTATSFNAVLPQTEVLGTIIDNDGPTVFLTGPTGNIFEGNTGTKDFPFVVSLSPNPARAGVLTTRVAGSAGDSTGELTMNTGFDLAPGDKIDLRWTGGERLGMTVGTIAGATGNLVSISGGTGAVLPAAGTAITATRLGSRQPITLNYQTVVTGAAKPGEDFQAANASITLNPGETTKTINVKVIGDTIVESNSPKEKFSLKVTLADSTRAVLDPTRTFGSGSDLHLGVDAEITDDDGPSISVNDVAVVEGSAGTTNVTFTVSLSFVGINPVSVNYTTVDFTAFAGSDYDFRGGSLTFAPGERIKFVTVPVRGDQFAEPTETFRLVLSNISVDAVGGKTVGVATITTDEAVPAPTQTVGLFAKTDSVFFLKETNAAGPGDRATGYGPPGNNWTPLAGDWNGDGIDTFGFYNPANSTFLLKNSNTGGPADLVYSFGSPNGKPIVGDWNGDGIETVGVYNPANGEFRLRNTHSAGAADATFTLSGVTTANAVPIAGDWNGDNIDTVGLFDPATAMWHLKNSNTFGSADNVFQFGPANSGWLPVTGDFNGDRVDSIGLHEEAVNSAFFLRNSNTAGNADLIFTYGPPGAQWKAVFGNWDVPLASAQLLASESAPASAGAPVATQSELDGAVDAALARWLVAGLTADQRTRLSQVDVRLTDLPEGYLGLAMGDTVYIDQNAAGRGWFVDLTPGSDEEFAPRDGRLRAIDASLADGRVDLLTVVAHELGHVLGLDDLDAGHEDLMAGALSSGVRRLPTDSILDDVFGADDDWR